jgi:hypothetical protein
VGELGTTNDEKENVDETKHVFEIDIIPVAINYGAIVPTTTTADPTELVIKGKLLGFYRLILIRRLTLPKIISLLLEILS